jgi:hypothetical protein
VVLEKEGTYQLDPTYEKRRRIRQGQVGKLELPFETRKERRKDTRDGKTIKKTSASTG